MYRVELKGFRRETLGTTTSKVPNVPCGVESSPNLPLPLSSGGFLMYRVELKVSLPKKSCQTLKLFLMYRVELKEVYSQNLEERGWRS